MANNYSPFTVYPTIPNKYITEDHLELLGTAGIDSESSGPHETYFYCEMGASEDIETWMFEDEDDNPLTRLGKDSIPWDEVFQDIIRKSNGAVEMIIVKGCYYCDKMRGGEFGGFWRIITAGGVDYGDSDSEIEAVTSAYWSAKENKEK